MIHIDLYCSNDACRRAWSSAPADPLPLVPVTERRPVGDRRWHPCPTCMDGDAVFAAIAHRLRERTASEIAAVAGD